MSYHYSFLSKEKFPQIHKTFVQAFADYRLDMSYLNEERLRNRAIKNGVDFGLSVGAFYEGGLIGFTLVGIDEWKGALSAFDAGTGIIPKFRGRGIAKQMFDYAIPRLREKGAKTFVLEVLKTNHSAIKAYQKVGFSIVREFDCFELDVGVAHLNTKKEDPLEVRTVRKSALPFFKNKVDWQPSWENSFSSIERIPDDLNIICAFVGNRPVGLLVYYPLLSWILSLVVTKNYRRQGIATRLIADLLHNLPEDVRVVKVINVEHSDAIMQGCLRKIGFVLYTSQYEMEFQI